MVGAFKEQTITALPEPVLIKFYDAMWHYWATMSQNPLLMKTKNILTSNIQYYAC